MKELTNGGFSTNGYTFHVINQHTTKNVQIVLYSQEKEGKVYSHEIHIMRREGNSWMPRSKSEFGTYAWSMSDPVTARKIYAEKVAQHG